MAGWQDMASHSIPSTSFCIFFWVGMDGPGGLDLAFLGCKQIMGHHIGIIMTMPWDKICT